MQWLIEKLRKTIASVTLVALIVQTSVLLTPGTALAAPSLGGGGTAVVNGTGTRVALSPVLLSTDANGDITAAGGIAVTLSSNTSAQLRFDTAVGSVTADPSANLDLGAGNDAPVTVTPTGTLITIPVTTVSSTAGDSVTISGIQVYATANGTTPDYVGNENITVAVTGGLANGAAIQVDAQNPTFTNFLATPSPATTVPVTITFDRSEALNANPAVSVNGFAATYTSFLSPTYTYTYTVTGAEGQGPATIAATGTDVNGNPGVATELLALTIDTLAPNFTGISPATGTTVNGTATISFTENNGPANNPECSVDNLTWYTCVSGVTKLQDIAEFAALPEGAFTLYLQDTDAAGNNGTGSVAGIIKDSTSPSAPDALNMVVASNTPPAADTIVGNAGAVEASSTVKLWSDAGLTAQIGGDIAAAPDGSFVLTSIGDNLYGTVYVTSTDTAGNQSSATAMTNDINAPVVTLTPISPDPTNDNSPVLTGNATDDLSNVVSVEYRVNGGGWVAATPADGLFNTGNENYLVIPGILADGAYTIEVRATDSVGNIVTSYASDSFTVDTVAPTGTVSLGTPTIYSGDLVQEVTVTYSEPMDQTSVPTIAFSATTGTWSTGGGIWTSPTTWSQNFTLTDADELTPGVTATSSNARDLADNTEGSSFFDVFDVDTQNPAVLSVTSTTADGYYNAGDIVTLTVNFDDTVVKTGNPRVRVQTNNGTKYATYASGSGTASLTFNYTVVATGVGDNSADWTYFNTSALQLNSGTIKDAVGNNAVLTLPDPTVFAGAHDIVIDTTAPTGTVTVGTPTIYDGDLVQEVTVTYSEPMDGASTPVVSFTAGAWTPAAGSWTTGNVWQQNFTHDGTNQAVANVQATSSGATDLAGNTEGSSFFDVFDLDTLNPTVTNVTSTTPNAIYGLGSFINVEVAFTEGMNVSGSPRISLETNNGPSYAIFSTIAPANTLQFAYGVTLGDWSNDLDYTGAPAFDLNGATVTDLIGNVADVTLPIPGGPGSLGFNNNLVIDTQAPAAPSVTLTDPVNQANVTSVSIVGTGEANATVNYTIEDGTPGAPVTGTDVVDPVGNINITGIDVSSLDDGTLDLSVTLTDATTPVGNVSSPGTDTSLKDVVAPTDPTPSSTSHTPSVWSNVNIVDVIWSGEFDATSGVDGFYTEWNTDPTNMAGPVIKEYEESVHDETSPALADGANHYFHIATVDNAGNWTSTEHLGPFWIDTVVPNAPTIDPVTTPVNADNQTVTGTAEADSLVTITGGLAPVTQQLSGGATNYSILVSLNQDATNNLAVTATDAATNVSPATNTTIVEDSTAPSSDPSGFTSSPPINTWSNDNTVQVDWSTGGFDALSGVDGYSYSFTQGAFDVPDATKDIEETDTSVTSAALSPDGAWWFHIRTVDNAGNWTSTAHYGPFWIDITEPTVTLNPYAPDPTNDNTPTLTGNAQDSTSFIVSVEYQVDSGAWNAASASDGMFDSGNENYTFTTGTLSEGDHTIDVRATDAAGNVVSILNLASDNLFVDTQAPVANAGPDVTTNATFNQDGSATDTGGSGIATYAWTKQSGPGTVTFGSSGNEDTTVSADTDGTYTIRLNATDNAGNDAFDEFTLVWDTTSPSAGVTIGPDGADVTEDSIIVFAGTTELDADVKLEVFSDAKVVMTDTDGDGNWRFEVPASDLGQGAHEAWLTVTDSLGNSLRSLIAKFNVVAVPSSVPAGDTTVSTGWSKALKWTTREAVTPQPVSDEAKEKLREDVEKTAEGIINAAQASEEEGTNPWQTVVTVLAILIIAVGVGTAGYYTYEWWATRGQLMAVSGPAAIVPSKKTKKKTVTTKRKSKNGGNGRKSSSRW